MAQWLRHCLTVDFHLCDLDSVPIEIPVNGVRKGIQPKLLHCCTKSRLTGVHTPKLSSEIVHDIKICNM